MTKTELKAYKGFIDRYFEEFECCFPRSETREWARRYIEGLLLDMERNNCWQMAQALKLPPSRLRALQNFLSTPSWDWLAVSRVLRTFVDEFLGSDDGILIVDESSVQKWGQKSVGVAKQYLGSLGKTENGQVSVYLIYATPRAHTYLDFRLYLPEAWLKDEKRCREAGVPEGIVFRTKPELAREIVINAIRANTRSQWLTADEAYGGNPAFLDAVDAMGLWYVVEVPSTTTVFKERPRIVSPRRGRRARTGQKPRILKASGQSAKVRDLGKNLCRKDWKIYHIADGAKGPLEYEFAFRRVVEKRGRMPGRDAWLMFRRSLFQDTEVKYYLANAPANMARQEMARVGSSRWPVEATFKEGKGQSRLDQYEVRCWNSYHHHMVLTITAHAFLTRLLLEGGKR